MPNGIHQPARRTATKNENHRFLGLPRCAAIWPTRLHHPHGPTCCRSKISQAVSFPHFSRLKTRWPTTFFDKAAKQLIQQPSDQHGLKYIFELHLSAKERLKKACFAQKSGQKYGPGPSWSMPNGFRQPARRTATKIANHSFLGPCLMDSVNRLAAQPQKLQTTAFLGSPDAPRPGQHACTIHTAPPAVARKFPKLSVFRTFLD